LNFRAGAAAELGNADAAGDDRNSCDRRSLWGVTLAPAALNFSGEIGLFRHQKKAC
jgi:hypothetical protein